MTVIIDVGSGFIKAGLVTDDTPRCVFPTLVGRPRRRYAHLYPGEPSFVGMDGVRLRNHISFAHPVDHGHVDDWLDMEDIWSHIYLQELAIEDQSQHPVLVTVPPRVSRSHKQNILEAFFESHDAPEVSLGVQGHLALYSHGKTSGLVVDVGEGVTQVVPTILGWHDSHSQQRSDFGGCELTMYLQKLLCDRGYKLTTRDDYEYVRIIKENLCYVSLNPVEEDPASLRAEWQLPDGVSLSSGQSTIELDGERFYAAEPLFEPRIVQRECPALTELIWQAINGVAMDHRKDMLENIILTGGTTLLPGLQERVAKELRLTAPEQARGIVNVSGHEGEKRLFAVWQGGRIYCEPAVRDAHASRWVSRAEWEEEGANVVSRKLRE